jgi:hypothetical protein
MPNLLMFADDAVRISSQSYGRSERKENEDLSSYGTGKSFVRSDRKMRRNSFANNWSALRSPNYAFLGGVPQIAFSAIHAQRGEALSTFVDNSIGIASYPAMSAIISPALRFMLPAAFGAAGTAAIASLIAIAPAYGLGKAAAAGVRYFSSFGYRLRHIEMGGNYEDTATAQNLRMKAISDMSSAMSYSRRWLGQEANFMRS